MFRLVVWLYVWICLEYPVCVCVYVWCRYLLCGYRACVACCLLQYYHSVRVFAGQDPACVWVGWVTPDYHYHSKHFNLNKTRTVTVTLGDERGRVHER